MIDPKFDKIVEKAGSGADNRSAAALDESERPQNEAPRRGLSINDTVAADANLSTGSRGTDTSGVRAGSGAGAGSSFVSPNTDGSSPAPNIAPRPTGSGATPVSDGSSEQAGLGTSSASGARASHLSYDQIASHAYRCWHERGCPEGSPEIDWQRAEADLRARQGAPSRADSAKA